MITISNAGRRLWGVAMMLFGFCSAAFGGQQSPSVWQQVALGWNASADPTVVGYYLYYGTTSGVYTNKINVGTNTTFTVSGLVPGSTYYFTTASYNAAQIESSCVPQIAYLTPGILTLTKNPTNGTMRVQFPVAASQSYILQTSFNLMTWSNLWSTPTQATNGWIEYDEPITNTAPGRYYRIMLN